MSDLFNKLVMRRKGRKQSLAALPGLGASGYFVSCAFCLFLPVFKCLAAG